MDRAKVGLTMAAAGNATETVGVLTRPGSGTEAAVTLPPLPDFPLALEVAADLVTVAALTTEVTTLTVVTAAGLAAIGIGTGLGVALLAVDLPPLLPFEPFLLPVFVEDFVVVTAADVTAGEDVTFLALSLFLLEVVTVLVLLVAVVAVEAADVAMDGTF